MTERKKVLELFEVEKESLEEKIKTNIADKKFSFEGNGKLSRQESNDASKCEIFIVEGERKICPYPSFLLSQG